MTKKQNWIIALLALGGLGTYLWSKTSSVVDMIKLLTFTPRINGKPKFSLSQLTLPFACDIANRTEQRYTLSISAIFVKYKGNTVATTYPTATSVDIKPHAVSTLEGLDVSVGYLKLVQIGGDAINAALIDCKFDNFLSDIELDIAAKINDAIIFNFTVPLGKSKEVTIDKNTASVNGLGLVAANERRISPLSDYSMYIPTKDKLLNRDLIVIPNGSVDDTVSLMGEVARQYSWQTADLAKYLQKKSLIDTLRNIWTFVYTHIQYVPDSRTTEQVRTPLRTLFDQKGDCDCYATLIASILHNLHIPYKFRIAAYEAGRYQHVYIVVPYNNQMLVIDPVLDKCFAEKKPTKFKDF